MKKRLKHLDLFSGIGGFALTAQKLGYIDTKQFVELDPFCHQVLQKNFPNVPIHSEVKTFEPTESYDLITAGFPCQPHSLAGKRLASADSRDLWDYTLKVIEAVRSPFVLLENVIGLRTSENGNYFKRILKGLADAGYDAEWGDISVQQLGGCHRRKRLWIIATNPDSIASKQLWGENKDQNGTNLTLESSFNPPLQSFNRLRDPNVCRINDGIPPRLDGCLLKRQNLATQLSTATTPELTVNHRKRLKALGNAICPDSAYLPLKRIVVKAIETGLVDL